MSEPNFIYVTYIRATPERVWNGLLDAKFTRQYWAHENVSNWKPGSSWEHRRLDDERTLDLVGEVVESTPPRRLVLTWADPADKANRAKMFAACNSMWGELMYRLKGYLEGSNPGPRWTQ